MVNKFGDYTFGGGGPGFLENIIVVKKVIAKSGKYKDYSTEIQTSIKLGFQPYRIASEKSPTLVYAYDKQVWCLGSTGKVIELVSQETITETNHLAYWVEGDVEEGDGIIAIKGDQGRRGEQGSSGDRGQTGSKGDKGEPGVRGRPGGDGKRGASGAGGPPGKIGKMGPPGVAGERGVKGSDGGQGTKGETGSRGAKGERGERGVEGTMGPSGKIGESGPAGTTGRQGAKGSDGVKGAKGERGSQGSQGGKGDRGERGGEGSRGEMGPTGKEGQPGKPCTEKNIMRMLYTYMSPQLIENYRRTNCYLYYRIEREDDGIEFYKHGEVKLKEIKKIINMSARYGAHGAHSAVQSLVEWMAVLESKEYPALQLYQERKNRLHTFQDQCLDCDPKKQKKHNSRRYYLECRGDAWYTVIMPTDYMDHTTIFIVYQLTNYHVTREMEECNYLWSSGIGQNQQGVCFLKNRKTLRIHGAMNKQKATTYTDVSDFGDERNPCAINEWNVLCLDLNRTRGSYSNLWINRKRILTFDAVLGSTNLSMILLNTSTATSKSTLLIGYVASFELYNKGQNDYIIEAKMNYLCDYYDIK